MADSPPPAPPPPPHHLPTEQCRDWLDLPREVTESILKRLSIIEILTSAQKVCLLWRNICKGPSMWRTLDMAYVPDSWDMHYDLEDMCRHAVDLSCGQLVRIQVGYFCTDHFLKYITESSSELRYLGLLGCYKISCKGFSEAAANIPLLEDLELSFCSWPKIFLQAIGSSCPHLKSLKLRSKIYWGDPFEGCDLSALAIAENMPGLVRLLLSGNRLTNDGVQAILDGCPDLQSLGLWRCRYVSLEGDFGRKCSERIKKLRFHNFSDKEFEKVVEESGDYDYDYDDEHSGLEYRVVLGTPLGVPLRVPLM